MTRFAVTTDRARELVTAVTDAAERDDDRVLRTYTRGVWSCLIEPGDGIAGRLIAALGPVAALRAIADDRLDDSIAAACGVSAKEMTDGVARWRPRLSAGAVEASFAAAARANVRLTTPDDEVWPRGLGDLGEHMPVCLWVRGDIGAVSSPQRSLAVVGARAATGYGEHVAMELAAELAGRGVAIVSGAAYGIDGAAHRAALTAGGKTVALLAGGVDRAYPLGHSRLLEQIAASGGIASEVPCGSAPTRWRFLQRNRLIAAAAGAVVVVEAGWRSGSLNTAGHAAALGRPLGAVPGPVTSAASAGCHRILREYDAQCITGPDTAAELLGIDGARQTLFDDPDSLARTDDLTRVADALASRSWRDVTEIARRCGMSASDVEVHLGIMQLSGEAESAGGGWRRLPSQHPTDSRYAGSSR